MALINHIELRVGNLNESERFYDPVCEFLGYEKHHRMKASILYRKKRGIGDLILVRTRKAGQGKVGVENRSPHLERRQAPARARS